MHDTSLAVRGGKCSQFRGTTSSICQISVFFSWLLFAHFFSKAYQSNGRGGGGLAHCPPFLCRFLTNRLQQSLTWKAGWAILLLAPLPPFSPPCLAHNAPIKIYISPHISHIPHISPPKHNGVLDRDSSFVALSDKKSLFRSFYGPPSTLAEDRYFRFRTKCFPIARNVSHNQISRHL